MVPKLSELAIWTFSTDSAVILNSSVWSGVKAGAKVNFERAANLHLGLKTGAIFNGNFPLDYHGSKTIP
jgi:hypothetical protein